MGNSESQFEDQFRQLYKFVGIVQDRTFKGVKIYRRIKFNFDYIMVIEKDISEFISPLEASQNGGRGKETVANLQNKFQLIRRFQNECTTRLSYSLIVEGKGLKCKGTYVRLYMQYFNHTLNDYLTALRSNKSFLGQDELKFVMGHLAESMFVLKSLEMEIYEFWLHLDNLWITVDQGEIVVNPCHFIYENALISDRSREIHRIDRSFEPIDLVSSRSYFPVDSNLGDPWQQAKIQNLLELFIEMTRYMSTTEMVQTNQLFAVLRKCRSLKQIQQSMKTSCQQLNVQQFGQMKQTEGLYMRDTKI